MAEIIVPQWTALDEVVRKATNTLIVCTPYFTAEGVGRVFDNLQPLREFRFWTRLSPSDWVAGASDPEELLALLEIVEEHHTLVTLSIHQRLHAKLYVADSSLAIVGSSNLSGGGFSQNLEILVRFRGDEVASVLSYAQDRILPKLRPLRSSDLLRWINEVKPTIDEARRNTNNQPEILAPAQAKLDTLLGFGGARQVSAREPDIEDLNKFVEWLRRNENLPGAEVLVRRHDNPDGQNLTGHFKQCFFGAYRFLKGQSPSTMTKLSTELLHLASNDIHNIEQERLVEDWTSFLDGHATDQSGAYNFSVLRGILPPSLGGTRLGGGGGSSTFKRMLPLVACYCLRVVS